MTKRPFILLTNDDGIHASGIRHLWEAIHEYADVAIVAPTSERSGSGLSITYVTPLTLVEVPWEMSTKTTAWSLNGTPADCVKMALGVILERRPDMIVSGVNRGSNAGRTVLYSGTIGAVIEGILKGIPGIALSFSDFEEPPLALTKKTIHSLIQHALEHPLPTGTFLNVNFPLNFKDGHKGFKMTRQGEGCWLEAPQKRESPHGTTYYWLGGSWESGKNEHPESDVFWLDQGYITATPIHVKDITDDEALSHHKMSFESKIGGIKHPSMVLPA